MPLNEDNSINYWGNDNPICPHCDKDIDASEHSLWELFGKSIDDTHEIDCPFCGKNFKFVARLYWKFDTDEQEDA